MLELIIVEVLCS